jgi:hypothetical protein
MGGARLALDNWSMLLPAWLAWIENNLLVLGLLAVLAGLSLGVLCSGFQARRTRAARRPTRVRPNTTKRPPAPGLAREPTPEKLELRRPALERDDRAVRLVNVHHLHSGAAPLAPTGSRRRGKVPPLRAR